MVKMSYKIHPRGKPMTAKPAQLIQTMKWIGSMLVVWLVTGCGNSEWNNPYPASESNRNILYSSFSERPKHLDPVRSYSANEYEFIAQIYEPLLQYHFLKRPYQLVPLAAKKVPVARYYDAEGRLLPELADSGEIDISEYVISIKQGMRYQPHPALAKDKNGNFIYHSLDQEQIAASNTLADFPLTGTREVTADDFVYQIKRLAFPKLNSPIAGIVGEYIIGFSEYGKKLTALYDQLHKLNEGHNDYFDLRPYQIEGVEVLDR
jgi:oligopeptide transport system substrate-binding protein